jgi:hypothetical protein
MHLGARIKETPIASDQQSEKSTWRNHQPPLFETNSSR